MTHLWQHRSYHRRFEPYWLPSTPHYPGIFIWCQVKPIFLDFQIPPVTPPVRIVIPVASLLLNRTVRVLPAALFGPTWFQLRLTVDIVLSDDIWSTCVCAFAISLASIVPIFWLVRICCIRSGADFALPGFAANANEEVLKVMIPEMRMKEQRSKNLLFIFVILIYKWLIYICNYRKIRTMKQTRRTGNKFNKYK